VGGSLGLSKDAGLTTCACRLLPVPSALPPNERSCEMRSHQPWLCETWTRLELLPAPLLWQDGSLSPPASTELSENLCFSIIEGVFYASERSVKQVRSCWRISCPPERRSATKPKPWPLEKEINAGS